MQAVTDEGRLRYSVVFPKAKKGDHAIKKIKTQASLQMHRDLKRRGYSELCQPIQPHYSGELVDLVYKNQYLNSCDFKT